MDDIGASFYMRKFGQQLLVAKAILGFSSTRCAKPSGARTGKAKAPDARAQQGTSVRGMREAGKASELAAEQVG